VPSSFTKVAVHPSQQQQEHMKIATLAVSAALTILTLPAMNASARVICLEPPPFGPPGAPAGQQLECESDPTGYRATSTVNQANNTITVELNLGDDSPVRATADGFTADLTFAASPAVDEPGTSETRTGQGTIVTHQIELITDF
jgi:hypothetical protein